MMDRCKGCNNLLCKKRKRCLKKLLANVIMSLFKVNLRWNITNCIRSEYGLKNQGD